MPQTLNVPTGENIITGPYNICLAGVDLGLTSGGVTFSQANSFEDVRGDQTRSLIKRFKTQSDYTITVNMQTLSLDRLRIIFGQEDTKNIAGTVLCFQDAGACSFPEEFDLTIKGPGPGCGCRNFHFPRVIVTPDSVDYNIALDTVTELSVEFTALPDANGLIGCVADVCDQIATDVDTLVALTCTVGSLPDYSA